MRINWFNGYRSLEALDKKQTVTIELDVGSLQIWLREAIPHCKISGCRRMNKRTTGNRLPQNFEVNLWTQVLTAEISAPGSSTCSS